MKKAFATLILTMSLLPALGSASDNNPEVIVRVPDLMDSGSVTFDSKNKRERDEVNERAKYDPQTHAVLAELKILRKTSEYKEALTSLNESFKLKNMSPKLVLEVLDRGKDLKSFQISFDFPMSGRSGVGSGCKFDLRNIPEGPVGKKKFDTDIVAGLQSCASQNRIASELPARASEHQKSASASTSTGQSSPVVGRPIAGNPTQ